MRRRLVAVLAVALLAVTAGCAGMGFSGADTEEVSYDWNTSATVSVDVATGSYQAVYRVNNTTELSFSMPTELTGDQPISLSAVKFQYPNGTVVNESVVDVSETRSATVVSLPNDTGQVAFTAPAGQRTVTVSTPVDGSYEVVLPGGMDVVIPVLGHVDPGGYERSVEDGRVHLSWESYDGGHIEVNYYYQQDVYIFAGVIVLAALIGVAGAFYLRNQVRRLRQYREDAGLDVE
ncbi:DUF5803 family protein [Salarchaeum sp. JOR-1]|uniref:DUF5803 family protein n=1 Tax=Salarchaeum sp. JOR-1 TaxID=2599399 RepID=UPI00119858F4|nr:DUF5803 family protein [Salarchaeum sp. JOR-1]QDX41383.1 hypothetical protein FQU85_10910 [Salarchaeum sp. JOR-1]